MTARSTLFSLALLILGAAHAAAAQVVAGTVSSEGTPVVGATVRLLELDRAQRTGSSGEFTFANVPAGTHRVFVSAVGFASRTDTLTVMAGTGGRVLLLLRRSAVSLTEVVVTASPVARTTNDLYQPASSKSQVGFLASPGMSIAEKIADLPGVAVRGNGSAPSRPILRGMSDNEVLVLENGLRMGDIATYDPAHATPVAALEVSQVDVVRGPATILYGPSSIGGIVNVITDVVPAVSDHAASGTVALEGNSVSDGTSGYFKSQVSSGTQAFYVSGGAARAHDTRIPRGAYVEPGSGTVFQLDRLPQTFERSGEVGAGYSYQGDFGTIGIGGKHFEMNYGIPGVPPNADFEAVPPSTSRIAQRRNMLEMRGLFNTGDGFARQLRVSASVNDYNHAEFPTEQDSSGIFEPQANHFRKQEFNGVLQLLHRPIAGLTGTVGLWTNLERLTIDGDEPLGPNSTTTGIAAYLFEEYAASARTKLQAGVRYDYNRIQTNPFAESSDSVFRTLRESRQSNALTASLGAIQALGGGFTASLNVARSFRAPTVQELFASGLDAPSGTYSVGTTSLEPETALGVDASLRGEFEQVSVELTPFVNYVNHYIYGFLRGDTIQGFPVRQFAATRARLAGFEAGIQLRPRPELAFKASADYVNSQDTQRQEPLPFTPPLRGLLRGTWQGDTHMALAEVRLAASQSRLGEGDTPTGGYAVLNLGVGTRLVQRGVVSHLSLHVDNALNTVYRDHLSVIKDFLPQPGRGVRLNYALTY